MVSSSFYVFLFSIYTHRHRSVNKKDDQKISRHFSPRETVQIERDVSFIDSQKGQMESWLVAVGDFSYLAVT